MVVRWLSFTMLFLLFHTGFMPVWAIQNQKTSGKVVFKVTDFHRTISADLPQNLKLKVTNHGQGWEDRKSVV